LLDLIEQGFKQYRVEPPIQLKFLIQLSQTFGLNGAVVAEVTELNLRAGEHTNEATISPGGPWLLGQDALYELAEPG